MSTPTAPTRSSFAVAGGTGLPVPLTARPIRQRSWESSAPPFLRRTAGELAAAEAVEREARRVRAETPRKWAPKPPKPQRPNGHGGPMPNPFDHAQAVSDYRGGMGIRALEQKHRTSWKHLQPVLAAAGVEWREPNSTRKHTVPDDVICADYRAGMSKRGLAKKHGIGWSTARRILVDNGVTIRDKAGKA